ncbi:MAG TPA: hypothetical protein VF884_06620 [Nitrososphaeraceae archaeon]
MVWSLEKTNRFKEITLALLDEMEDYQRQIFPDYAPTFNRSLKNKIVTIKQILGLIERYPEMSARMLLFLIECRIEGEMLLLVNTRMIDVTDKHLDNIENMEHIRFLVRKAGKVKWED